MKKYIFPLLATVIGVIGILIYLNKNRAKEVLNTSQITPTLSITNQTSSHTLTEINTHKEATDCWMAVEGKVYDVSTFIASGKHKGGLTILNGCGKDATELFNIRPNSGTPHSQKARELLSQFYIGDLSK
jgi:cytochrome b involved in lipid metabolism